MAIELETPTVDGLEAVLEALRSWQVEGDQIQLHPGDIGWHWRFGADAMAAALRTWTRDGELVAVGFVDDEALRMGVAPSVKTDVIVASGIRDDLLGPGVLTNPHAAIEVAQDAVLRELLGEAGWEPDESWTPLHRDLTSPVEEPEIRIEPVRAELVEVRCEIQRSGFANSTFTADKWQTMADGPAYADARCLVGFLGDQAVGAITVWSAGAGRPGLIEPLAVHPDARGKGVGRAMNLAGAAVLRDLGASSATVCTETEREPAVAAYRSAGFDELPPRLDLVRR